MVWTHYGLYYGLDTPPSEAMTRDINLHNATIFDKTRVLKFFMKEEGFILVDFDTPVHSRMGLLYIACKIAADGPMNIPARKIFQWDTVPAYQESNTGCAQSMGEATFRIINHFASEIKMDSLFLARNARIIMEYKNWLIETSDPTKRTPFMVALDLFEAVKEADKIKRAQEEKDAWPSGERQTWLRQP
jgi:hypothetical protein